MIFEDELYHNLVAHYERLGRLQGPPTLLASPSPQLTRTASICYNDGAFGRLEVSTIIIAGDPGVERHLTWTRNVSAEPGYVAPEGQRGSTMTGLSTFDQVLAVIEGNSSR